MRLGVLQNRNTFGGEAGQRLLELYPEFFDEIVYVQTHEEALGFFDGRAQASCAPQQMTVTGYHAGTQSYIARPGSKLNIIGEVTHAYHCSLLTKSGATLGGIKRILGHTGSITQSRTWLEQNLPNAKIEIVDTSSMDAAKAVGESDGSVASVGTPAMAREFGLTELHQDIDGGSVGAYWAITPEPIFSESPTRLVVAGRFDDDGRLTDIVCGLAGAGFRLDTIIPLPSTERLYEYDAVLRFSGMGSLAGVRAAVGKVAGTRLAGAFIAKE